MDTLPILEYDPSPTAIIEPLKTPVSRPAPQRGVLCFFPEVIQSLRDAGRLTEIGVIGSELRTSLYVLRVETIPGVREVLVAHPGVGAPLAAGVLERIIALGVRRVIACGGCGVLHPEINAGHPVILTGAVRDEGTSYHYLPPSREVSANPKGVAALETACRAMGLEYRLGKAWTTDAFYRETPERRARRIAEGCDVVEMEAAAFFAVAEFRGVSFGQVVYGGDLVVPEGWDQRDWEGRMDDRNLMFRLAVDAALKLE